MVIKKEYVQLYKGIDLSQRRLPVLIADSEVKGPIIWITAAIHGDEVTGTSVILSLFQQLKHDPLLKGIIYTFPVLNPNGFEAISRHEVNEEEDLNRHFEKNSPLSLSKLHAELILQTILSTHPDYVIDLHTDSLNSIAYSIIDRPSVLMGKKVFLQSIGLARMLGFHWAIETDKNAGYQLQKCLSGRLITEGIPAITIELGGPLYVHEEFRYKGVNALWSMLKNFQMVRGSGKVLDISEPQRAYYFDERVKTQSTGIIHYKIMPGKKIYAGQILGKVRNIFGETIEIIRSKSEGILFSHEDQSICFPGQTLFTTAVEKKFVL